MRFLIAFLLLVSFDVKAQEMFQFKCPQPGSTLVASGNTLLTFTRQEGLTCYYMLPNGTERGWFAGFMPVTSPYASKFKNEVSKAWPARVGTKIAFQSIDGTSGWENEVIVRERKTITVPAGTFDVLVLDFVQEGNRNNVHKSTLRYYWAIDFGFHVKHEAILEKGTWGNVKPTPWEVPKVTRP